MSNEKSVEIPEELQHLRQRCEIWSRVMGYHRPVDSYNVGKQQEFQDRKPFNEQLSLDFPGDEDN